MRPWSCLLVLAALLLWAVACASPPRPFTLEEARAEALRAVSLAGFDVSGLRAEIVGRLTSDRDDPMFVVDVPGPRKYDVIVRRSIRKWSAIFESRLENERRRGTGRTGRYAITTEAQARERLMAMARRLGAPQGCVIDSLTLTPRPDRANGSGYAVVAAKVAGRVLGKPVFGRGYGLNVELDGWDGTLIAIVQKWSIPPLQGTTQRIDAARAIELAQPDAAKRAAARRLGPIETRLGYLAAIDPRYVRTMVDGRRVLRRVPPMTVMRLAWEIKYKRRTEPYEPNPNRVVEVKYWVDAETGEVSDPGP